jgi:hypothetical protein
MVYLALGIFVFKHRRVLIRWTPVLADNYAEY